MHWSDEAIILSAKKHGETSAVLRLLAREHGVYAGMARGGLSKRQRGVLQVGNLVNARWNARLSEQLGMFTCELTEANAALIMQDAARLAALTSACTLVEISLPERHPYPKLYEAFLELLEILKNENSWPDAYIRFELLLLAESGFGLDLSHCAATGQTEDLIYVSPKSGRAVSREAGEPYKEKLLRLPKILWRDSQNREHRIESDPAQSLCDLQDYTDGLALTGYFLEHWLLTPHHRKMPAARGRLARMVSD